MTTKFEKGEVVWGKIKGYPWWPAIIIDNNNLIYTIKFYNDNSLANLSSKFLLKYEENKHKISESNKKNKKLMEAIKFADSELNNNNTNEMLMNSNHNISETNYSEKSKMSIDNEKIKTKNINNSSNNINYKKLEKKNNNINKNNLINKSETMSNQNNRVNIFSIIKNSKNNNPSNKMNSRKPMIPPTPSIVEKNENLPPAQIQDVDKTNIEPTNNNKIIINKSLLRFDSDDEKKIFLSNINNETNETRNENILTKEGKESDEENIDNEEEDKSKEKEESYFIKIEIESLDIKSSKKKEAKVKSGNDEKMKEEKKREEEDFLLYQIDEYLCKIVDFFNNKQIEKLRYEKPALKKILYFLSKFKRPNFIEFLKRTNINKYMQFFINYFKSYDLEVYNLAKKVHRNFHIQFNKEYFSNQVANL